MTTLPRRRAPFATLVFATAATLACAGARAQGTDAQREACAPDAVNLCQDTIPDVPKTTACMKRHFAELSPRCQKEFSEATGVSRKGRVAKREVVVPAPAASPDTVEVVPAPAPEPGTGSYEGQIRAACKQGLIDPFTCRNTLDAIRGFE